MRGVCGLLNNCILTCLEEPVDVVDVDVDVDFDFDVDVDVDWFVSHVYEFRVQIIYIWNGTQEHKQQTNEKCCG